MDTWGVDFALLDQAGDLLQNPVHYRDQRTDGMPELVFSIVPPDEIYEKTGIQFMQINTLFQVFAAARDESASCSKWLEHFVTIPDLLNYWLTGNITCEYTNATTTQMFDHALALGSADARAARPSDASLQPVTEPGSVIAFLWRPHAVIAPACHDTGSPSRPSRQAGIRHLSVPERGL